LVHVNVNISCMSLFFHRVIEKVESAKERHVYILKQYANG